MRTSCRSFQIAVRPSPATNDHEVRFIADGVDIITRFWNDLIGLDPDDILIEPCPLRSGAQTHQATVARCSCGVIGCGSIEVAVSRSPDDVMWTWGDPDSQQAMKFSAAGYDAEVERALADTSWETPDRTAARLLAGKLSGENLGRHGLSYCWASGRVRKGKFTVSLNLEPGPYQVLLHLPWQLESPECIAERCAVLLADPPATWNEAEWFAQRPDLGAPPLAGPNWRRGGS